MLFDSLTKCAPWWIIKLENTQSMKKELPIKCLVVASFPGEDFGWSIDELEFITAQVSPYILSQ